jgi:hypothetical protein
MRATAFIVSGALLVAAAASPASANCYGGNCGLGAAFAGGLLGGILGAAAAPPPAQPQQIIIIVPQQPAPVPAAAPAYAPPPPQQRVWWCGASHRWFPDVQTCSDGWTHR